MNQASNCCVCNYTSGLEERIVCTWMDIGPCHNEEGEIQSSQLLNRMRIWQTAARSSVNFEVGVYGD